MRFTGFSRIAIIVFILVGVIFFVLSSLKNNFVKIQTEENLALRKTQESVAGFPTPTPFQFQELTIPYLRNRSYRSKLGDLTKVSENESYTSYMTSYSSDGFKVYGLLTIPKGLVPRSSESEVGWPAIIFIHGYIPPESYQTTVNYSSYVDYLAKNGFVVFKIDLRGHGNSEGNASGAYYSGDYVIDTLNAYSALQSNELINGEGIGLWGHSMAGNVVIRSLASKPGIPAAVIWAGAVYTYSDLQEIGIEDNSYRAPPINSERARKRTQLRELYGDFNPESEFWKQVPATNYLDGITGAIEIHHAVDDKVVPIEYSRNLMKILDRTSIPHELFEYPSGGHNLTGSTFTEAMQRSVEFYKKYFK